GHDLVMVQSADLKPGESAYRTVADSCNAIAKNTAAWSKLNAETIPALNKLLAAQSVPALPVASSAAAAPICTP
ncbi:MAG TPA: hypothetical protein VJX70_12725, partial [Candidatus Acidoferrum sp.]|nr:hypothetical protein [Candidatus Acidoferrum sp.]